MAFECYNKSVACMQCKDPAPYFKLFRSTRPRHLWVDSEGHSKPLLLCKECELSTRVTEFNNWTPQQRLEDPNYPSMNSVKQTITRQSKGEKWYETGQRMKVALREIKEDLKIEKRGINRASLIEEPEDHWTVVDDRKSTMSLASSSRSERTTLVLRRAKGMAEALFSAILTCDKMLDSVAYAGEQMLITAEEGWRSASRIGMWQWMKKNRNRGVLVGNERQRT